jgi:hypothetical protein
MDTTNRFQLEMQVREAREAEIEARVKSHKLRADRIRKGTRRRAARAAGVRKVPLDFLAIGDSWFEYPPLHGQATTQVLSWENQQKILNALTDPNTTEWNNGTTADGILVSAGGDDIVGDQFAIYVDYHGSGLDKDRFQGVLASVRASYMDLLALRDIAADEIKVDPKNIPIFAHSYDYAIPNGQPAGWPIPLAGPWLQPPLEFAGYDYAEGLQIVAQAIDGFYSMLNDLAMDKITLPGKKTNNFILIDTRNTLTRDSVRPTGWANEIHPYTEGFTVLAGKFLTALQKHFPGKI